MGIIVLSVLSLSLLGFIAGILLGYAYEKFSVKEDPRLLEILGSLPGVNCGACGYAGCRGFAEALLAGKVDILKCPAMAARVKKGAK